MIPTPYCAFANCILDPASCPFDHGCRRVAEATRAYLARQAPRVVSGPETQEHTRDNVQRGARDSRENPSHEAGAGEG